MKLEYDNCFAIVLCHKESKVIINSIIEVSIPALYLTFIDCRSDEYMFISDNEITIIKLDNSIIKSYIASINNISYKNGCYSKKNHLIYQSNCNYLEIFSIAAELSYVEEPTSSEEFYRTKLLEVILHWFTEDKSFLSHLANAVSYEIKHRVHKIIMQDIRFPWTLDRVASLLYVSSSTLKKKLRHEGTSYQKILIDCRMQYSSNILFIDSNCSISELAYECGYNHVSYFICAFKKHYGMTPNQFKQSRTIV